MRVELPVVGPTYTNRSLSVGNQHTQNFYIEANAEAAALMPFPGLKSFATTGTSYARGLCVYNDELYAVTGTELYTVSQSGASTLIGTIPGTDRVTMVDDGGSLVIATGSTKPYQYDGTTITAGVDADLPDARTVAHINDRVIYEQSTGIAFADLGIPLTVNSANVLLANTRADDVKAVITHRQQVFTFGTKTIEPSYFTGSGTPPYSRVNNAVQEIGTTAPYSIDSNKEFIYFLGSDRRVYRMSGLNSQAIDNPAIGQAIQGYSDVSDAYGVCITADGQNWFLLSFPTGGATWLFNEASGFWTSLAYGVDDAQHLICDYAYIYDKHLVSDRRNGNIYELDFDTFTDNGDVIQRQRATQSIDSRLLGGEPGKQLYMNYLELEFETGVSLVSAEAQIIMQYSDDDGRTWSQEYWQSIGEQGDFEKRVRWFGFERFYKRRFRFTMTDPVKWVLIRLIADVEVGLD
jgi:hypothetical protein